VKLAAILLVLTFAVPTWGQSQQVLVCTPGMGQAGTFYCQHEALASGKRLGAVLGAIGFALVVAVLAEHHHNHKPKGAKIKRAKVRK